MELRTYIDSSRDQKEGKEGGTSSKEGSKKIKANEAFQQKDGGRPTAGNYIILEETPRMSPEEEGEYCYKQGQKCRIDDHDSVKAAEWYRKGATLGNQECQYHMARLYETGDGVPQNYQKAAEYYLMGIAGKSDYYIRSCKEFLGGLYERGQGVEQSFEMAAKLYSEGHAWTKLGLLYQYGDGVPQSFEKAAYYYKKNVNGGQMSAMVRLGYLYEKGLGVPQSYEEAMRLYMKAPYGEGFYRIGDLYYHGKGVPSSKQKALEYYLKAAEKGYADAYSKIGQIYRYYIVDEAKAEIYAKKALELGSGEEETILGYRYENGYNGLPTSTEEAVKWYLKAAEKNFPEAWYHLAFCHLYKAGFIDKAKHFACAFRGACAGNETCQYMVGNHYEKGDLVPQSYSEAAAWYERATNNGHPSTGKMLANLYMNGLGVEMDLEKAAYWMSKFKY